MKIIYYVFIIAEKIVKVVPIKVTRTIARAGGSAYYYLFSNKRNLIKKNMRRALGEGASDREVKKTARKACQFYAEYWIDIIWLPTRSLDYVRERFDRIGEANLVEAIGKGKGMIVVLPHYGSWEAGAFYLTSLAPMASVAEVLKPKELYDYFVKLRAACGIEIFPFDNTPETRDRLVKALNGGVILTLLCDRDLKGKGVEVEFFGERTTLPPGPVALALRSGSPIVCVNVRNLPDGTWIGHAMEPIYIDDSQVREKVIKDTMQQIAYRLEELIREDPAQWHLFMPAWPSDRENLR